MKNIIVECSIYELEVRDDGGEIFQFVGSTKLFLEKTTNHLVKFKNKVDFIKKKFWYTFEIVTNFIGGYFVNKDNSNDCKRRKD